MKNTSLSRLLDILGLDEEPMGIFYTDQNPEKGFSPAPMQLPTRDREMKNEIDWQAVFGSFSCAVGHIWRARRKKTAAYFDAEHFGCPGAAFWMGFMKPQTETIIHYVSSGIPEHMAGELYCESPDILRQVFNDINPRTAPKKFCVVKPLSLFNANETPEVVAFFTRPESLSGLHQLAFFITNDPQVVASPWGPACGGLMTWPFKYLEKGETRAVVGGWDPSARKFFRPDELTFTVPYSLFTRMLEQFESSFLTTKTWAVVRKKIARKCQN